MPSAPDPTAPPSPLAGSEIPLLKLMLWESTAIFGMASFTLICLSTIVTLVVLP